ncbi:MAG TPA: M48 family metalloprotease, partial [Thermoanaerobaculia bacterium]
MKNRLFLLIAIAALFAALVAAQRQHAAAEPSAQSVLYLVADSERDLTTLPSHFTRISDADEERYGGTLADEYLSSRGKMNDDDHAVESYVNDVGHRLAPNAHRRIPYQFHYIPDRAFINAFALPGGHLFIGGGLLEHLTTEDELAAVLAHEIEHVDHFHCAERLQVEAALHRIPLAAVLQIPVAVFQAGYSKDQELEADREGVLLAARAGYSAAGALHAFQTLQKLSGEEHEQVRTPQGEMVNVAADVLTGYFRSHPAVPDRVAQVREMIEHDPVLAAHPERPLAAEAVFLAWHALDKIEEGKFSAAADLAKSALAQHPTYAPALLALCEADLGLGEYEAAQNVYRQLPPQDTDKVEQWAESRASVLFHKKDYDREIALVECILTVQPSHPRLLKAAASAYARKGDDAKAAERATMFRRLYSDQVSSAASEAERSADDLLTANRFGESSSMARLAVDFDTNLKSRTLGDAELAQAHFSEAAAAYEQAFDVTSSDAAWLHAFTDALGAARPRTAAQELQKFLGGFPGYAIPEAQVKIEVAGLALLAGNDAPARAILSPLEIAPELLARLGIWYLRAGRPADAATVLEKARGYRPGDRDVANSLGWTLFEENKPKNDDIGGSEDAVRHALEQWPRCRPC